MNQARVLLDANVLYPAPLRDLLLQLAVSDVIIAAWTERIHCEWIEALLRRQPWRERRALERTRDLMNEAISDCLIRGYEKIIPSLVLPDPDDRHVLAAAIAGRCGVILTHNTRDFPPEALAPHGIEAQNPDEFLLAHLSRMPGLFCAAVKKVRSRLKTPPLDPDEYLAVLRRQGLIETAAGLETFASSI